MINLIKKLYNKYKTFVKYIISAGISFAIDLLLFTIFSNLFKLSLGSYAIIVGTILARVISSFINYHINRNNVFDKKDGKKIDTSSFIKYVSLVIIQMFVSSFSVFALYNLTKINETLIKIPVECILFLVNYTVQKLFIFNEKKTKFPEFLYKYILVILSIFTTFSFIVELDVKKIVILTRYNSDFLLYLVFTLGIYFFYKKYFFKTERKNFYRILSVLFSLFLIFGYSFDILDSAYFVYGSYQFIIISIIKFISFYSFINLSLNLINNYITTLKIGNVKKNRIIELFEKHPFLFSCVALIICFLPYIIAFYPTIMSYDPANQIKEFMGIHNRYLDSVVLLDPNVTITNFNPVLHTILLGSCFKFGVDIGNVNFGLFVYSLIQITTMIAILAYSIKFLLQEKVPTKLALIVLAIYCLVPIFPFYALSTNKDTIFSLLLILYIINLYKLIKYDYKIKDALVMFIVGTLLFLMRNNGIYTIMLSLPFFLIVLKDKRKMILGTIVALLVAYTGYNKVVLPYFKITPTSIREMLSVPFQQTAALIHEEEKIIEEKDKKIISNILDYDIVKEQYNPELADPVKNTFNKNYIGKELKSYFNVWFKYLLKRPLIYIDATINNIYGYFYPNTSRWFFYYKYNTKLEEAGFDYHFNSFTSLRDTLSVYALYFQHMPLFSAFINIGFNVWIYFFLTVWLIVNKNKKFILMLLPALSLILVCIVSPANAYFRYALPFIMALPITVSLLFINRKGSHYN